MTQVLDPQLTPPVPSSSALVTWSGRLLSWFCWLAMAGVTLGALLGTFGVLPVDPAPDLPNDTLINFTAQLNDTAAQAMAMKSLQQDALFRVASLFPLALFLWALFSARQCFAGVSRGEYFARSTAAGLRNLGIAVLLYNTIAPVVTTIPKVLYLRRVMAGQPGELKVELSFTQPIALMLVFAGTVTLISAVMAHAAHIEDENRSFV